MSKWICNECGFHLASDEMLLQALNPFDTRETITGCPECKAVESTREACDEQGCWQDATIGTPTPSGYRRICYKHQPGRNPDADYLQEKKHG